MAKEVKLLGFWLSPFSGRIKIGLALKGVDFDYEEEDLSNKSALLLESNPVHKKIPVLIHRGKAIAESLIVLQYIDEAWPNGSPLLPDDPHQRSLARFWANFVDEKIYLLGLKTVTARGEAAEEALEEVRQNLEVLQTELGDETFFGGEDIGYVDIAAFSIIYLFQMSQEMSEEIGSHLKFTEERFGKLVKWLNKMRENKAVRDSLPPRAQHMAARLARIAHLRPDET